ncbi:MAG: penicillin-binding transpeptidase domain-containing protein [bacterium]|nr:penicillin-binding transpeptidase domain-containing protein [bacterium]
MSFRNPKKFFKKNLHQKNWGREIDPDEIFIDATNLPKFDQSQFEGRLEKPISKRTVIGCGILFCLILIVFSGKISMLQIAQGKTYALKSEQNSLRQTVIFPERGVIYDRNKILLASNVYVATSSEFSRRTYAPIAGLAHILGYVRYPAKDSSGFYYQDRYEGMDGVEKIYDQEISGEKGLKITDTNALGKVESESVIELPRDGSNLLLSVDSRIEAKLYELMKISAISIGFDGGAGVLMDVNTGEIITLVSFPEYDSNVMSDKTNKEEIKGFVQSAQKPFLNRVTDGLYTPGSIVKPFIALAALKEAVIDPKKEILSTGSISIPNPFDPAKKSVFKDWKAHGYVDMRTALAVSSDVYFYEIGGGFENQAGLGITAIEKYMRIFGFGETVRENPLLDKAGSIPSPKWKEENFKGDPWRIGDTYHTSIGQYGFQVTPMQAVRATASLANGGRLLNPTLLKKGESEVVIGEVSLPFNDEQITVVKEGMRQAVLSGTSKGLDIPQVTIAAKTGTAELGTSKKFVNSWIIGFLPYDKPRFAFAAIMEKGPYENTIGALYVMRQLFEWMAVNTPEYFK